MAALSFESGSSDFFRGVPLYSAACETFMRPAASSTALTMLW
jgi:hypothetical protein